MKRKTLQSFWVVGALLLLVCIPAFGIIGRPSVIVYLDDRGEAYTRISVFAEGDNGTLVVNRWFDNNGLGWFWEDLGLPPGANSISNPSAVTFFDSRGIQRHLVFVVTDKGDLAVYAPGFGRGGRPWVNLTTGLPGGIGQLNSVSAITDVDPLGNHRIFAFATDQNSNLVVAACTSSCEQYIGSWNNWSWFNYNTIWGNAPGCCISALSYDSYPNGSRVPKMAISGINPDGTLWMADGDDFQNLNRLNFGLTNDGHQWTSPTAIFSFSTPPQSAPCNSLVLYSGATDGHLNGLVGCRDTFFQSQLKFDLNVPPQLPTGKLWINDPTAITYIESDYTFRTSAFVSGANGQIYRSHVNGTQVSWDAIPKPSSSLMIFPSAITFWHYSPSPWMYVFAWDINSGDLVVNYCNNACDGVNNWNWADQGTR